MTDKHPQPAFSLETLSEAVRYNRFIVDRMRPSLGRTVLELGTGIGNLTPLFLEEAREVTAIDIDPSLIEAHRQRVAPTPALRVECVSLQELAGRPSEKGKYDAVVSSNVLEHIDDSILRDVVGGMHQVLKPGGNAVHWIPAFQAIYGSMDKAFGHYRRYDKKSASALFEQAGFRIVECSYWNMAGFFGWWLTGKVLKKQSVPRSSALTFDRFLMPLVSAMEPLLWRPFGQSLLIVAKKTT